MKKLNKLFAGIALVATLIAGSSLTFQGSDEKAAADYPVTTQSISSDPGGGGGH
jgi:hypothetical protein